LLNTQDIIIINQHIRAIVNSINYNDKKELICIEIKIFSDTLKVSELRKWMEEIYINYCLEKKNNLGNKRFFFNEFPVEPMKDIDTTALMQSSLDTEKKNEKPNYRWETASPNLLFTMNEFQTSKSLSNVFGNHVNELKDRLDLFINHPEWYSQRGIPYSLGILLHGIPGAGKTSTIKAIAKDTNRHIFNLSLRPYTTQKQLINLFYNDTIQIIGQEGNKQNLVIPLNQRIYVIEDIDCLSDIVMDRTLQKGINDNGKSLNLSFLLNLLDGILETPGRIIIITSNYPEKLDKALTRPGRIDINIEFKEASIELINEIINNFYSIKIEKDKIPEKLNMKLTPAEVIESLCCNYKNYVKAIEHLLKKVDMKKETKDEEKRVENIIGEVINERGLVNITLEVEEKSKGMFELEDFYDKLMNKEKFEIIGETKINSLRENKNEEIEGIDLLEFNKSELEYGTLEEVFEMNDLR